MINSTEIIKVLKDEMPYLEKQFGVSTLSLFGSYSKGNQKATSDVDILVTFNRVVDLFDFIRLENYLSENLGCRVDLVLKESLKPRIKDAVLTEAVPV